MQGFSSGTPGWGENERLLADPRIKESVLTVQRLDGAVLLLAIWLKQSSVEDAAEVTCRLQHGVLVRISQHRRLHKLVFKPVKVISDSTSSPHTVWASLNAIFSILDGEIRDAPLSDLMMIRSSPIPVRVNQWFLVFFFCLLQGYDTGYNSPCQSWVSKNLHGWGQLEPEPANREELLLERQGGNGLPRLKPNVFGPFQTCSLSLKHSGTFHEWGHKWHPGKTVLPASHLRTSQHFRGESWHERI